MHDKPSKFITHLTDKLKQRTDEVSARDRTIADRDSTIAALRSELEASHVRIQESDSLRASRDQYVSACSELQRQRDELERELSLTRMKLRAQDDDVDQLKAQIAAVSQRIAEMSARDAVLDQKDADIRALVAKVEGRMRARERQEASAILNRKAVAGATPGRNIR